MSKPMVVTIDGPAGAGKSTVAKALAKKLGISFMDTGAMYRAMTIKALRKGLDLEDEAALVKLAHETRIDLIDKPGQPLKVMLDDEDVSEAIRSQDVTKNTYFIARTPGVREVMVQWQRQIGEKRPVVGDGRDLGTVVFPEATFKFYLDAEFKVRCQRRVDELRAKGQAVDEAALARDLSERDQRDLNRKVGPLKKADDAIYVDSTSMTADQVVEFMVQKILERGSKVYNEWDETRRQLRTLEEWFLDLAWVPLVLFCITCSVVPLWRQASLSYAGREHYFFLTKLLHTLNQRPEAFILACVVIILSSIAVYQLVRRSWWRVAVHVLFVAWFVWFIGQPVAEGKMRETMKGYRDKFPKVTLENLGRISNRLEEYRQANGIYPKRLEELCEAALRPTCFDPALWTGGPFAYEQQGLGSGYKLRSAGWDAKLGTEDDIVW